MSQIVLRGFQPDLVGRVKAAMRFHKWILMQSATGSGKTVMGAKMIQDALAKGSTSIFVVPRRELLKQTAKTFQNFGIPYGFIAAGYTPNPFAKVQLATSGSLSRRLESTKVPNLLFPDETHFGKGELDRIIEWGKEGGAYGVGLSATPQKTDGTGLDKWYDHMETGPTVRELMDSGDLSEYRPFAVDMPDMGGVKQVGGDYSKTQLSSKMESDKVLTGSAVRHYKENAYEQRKLNIAFCTSIKHAELVAQEFREKGVSAQCIHGGMDDKERTRLIIAFARRQILVLTCADLLIFGFDLAAAANMEVTVECLSDLAPTKSLPKQMQKWGRAFRKKDYPAILFDHAGNFKEHGLPDDEQDWTLSGKEKRKRGEVEEPTTPTRQCQQCYFVHRPAPICPNCGNMYPVQARMLEEVEGDLIELKSRAKEKALKKRKDAFEQHQAQTYGELVSLGVMRGMKNPDGWARNIIRARNAKR